MPQDLLRSYALSVVTVGLQGWRLEPQETRCRRRDGEFPDIEQESRAPPGVGSVNRLARNRVRERESANLLLEQVSLQRRIRDIGDGNAGKDRAAYEASLRTGDPERPSAGDRLG